MAGAKNAQIRAVEQVGYSRTRPMYYMHVQYESLSRSLLPSTCARLRSLVAEAPTSPACALLLNSTRDGGTPLVFGNAAKPAGTVYHSSYLPFFFLLDLRLTPQSRITLAQGLIHSTALHFLLSQTARGMLVETNTGAQFLSSAIPGALILGNGSWLPDEPVKARYVPPPQEPDAQHKPQQQQQQQQQLQQQQRQQEQQQQQQMQKQQEQQFRDMVRQEQAAQPPAGNQRPAAEEDEEQEEEEENNQEAQKQQENQEEEEEENEEEDEKDADDDEGNNNNNGNGNNNGGRRLQSLGRRRLLAFQPRAEHERHFETYWEVLWAQLATLVPERSAAISVFTYGRHQALHGAKIARRLPRATVISMLPEAPASRLHSEALALASHLMLDNHYLVAGWLTDTKIEHLYKLPDLLRVQLLGAETLTEVLALGPTRLRSLGRLLSMAQTTFVEVPDPRLLGAMGKLFVKDRTFNFQGLFAAALTAINIDEFSIAVLDAPEVPLTFFFLKKKKKKKRKKKKKKRKRAEKWNVLVYVWLLFYSSSSSSSSSLSFFFFFFFFFFCCFLLKKAHGGIHCGRVANEAADSHRH